MAKKNYCGECCWMVGEDHYGQGICAKIFAELVNCSDTCHGDHFEDKSEMVKAVETLEQHNKWRRDEHVPNSQPMVDPKELGKAIDLAVEYIKTFMEL